MLNADLWRSYWPRIRPLITAMVLIIIFGFIGQYLLQNWSLLREHRWEFEWIWLLLALPALLIFWAGVGIGWLQTVFWNGTSVTQLAGLSVWTRSSLARYLPTPIWETGSRVYMTVQLGASWRSAAFSYAAGLGAQLATAFGMALAALSIWVEVAPIYAILSSVIVLLLILPFIYQLAHALLHRKMALSLGSGLASLIRWSSLYGLAYLLYGLAHLLVLRGLTDSLPPVHLVIGVSALAWALGTVNIFSPGGLGTRELVLIYGLQSYVDPPELFALSVLTRLLAIASEILLFLFIYLLASSQYGVEQSKAQKVT